MVEVLGMMMLGFFFLGRIDAAPLGGDAGGKFVANGSLLLFCGAATFSSFPFPENAKHKKAHIFRYAPLPQDLHVVSNWSSTHEVQTWVFHQPEYLEQLENVVKEADMKMTWIRPVGSRLFPNGIGLSRAGMVNLALIDKDFELGQLFCLRRQIKGPKMLELWLTQFVLRTSETLALLNLLLTNLSKLNSARRVQKMLR